MTEILERQVNRINRHIEHVPYRVHNAELEYLIDAEQEASLLPLNCWREQMESFYRKAIDEAWEEVKADGKV